MPTDRRLWAAFFALALLNNVIPFSLIVWGQEHVASGVASILNVSTPLFGVVVAHRFTSDERMTPGRVHRSGHRPDRRDRDDRLFRISGLTCWHRSRSLGPLSLMPWPVCSGVVSGVTACHP